MNRIKISTWNINGINSVIKKNSIQDYLRLSNYPPDILCLSEIRTNYESLEKNQYYTKELMINEKNHFKKFIFNCYENKKGYSGTAILSKYNHINYDFYENKIDESRIISIEYESFIVVNVYVPFSGYNFDRLSYRLEVFNKHFEEILIYLTKKRKHLIILGDLNVAHKDSDVHSLLKMLPGCSFEERFWFSKLLIKFDLVDVFRILNSNSIKFSYFSNRTKNNSIFKAGMRLDYILVSKSIINNVELCDILDNIKGSDHCPVEMIFNV